MIKSYLELNVFEVILFIGIGLIVDNWLVILEAATGVDPAVGVRGNIFFKLNEHANLGEDVVGEADVR